MMKLSSALLKVIICPVSGEALIYDRKNKLLVNKKDGLAYPIVDGVPILIASEAKKT